MTASLPGSTPSYLPRVGALAWRLAIVAAVLAVETLLMSYLIQRTPLDGVFGPARTLRDVQHWLFRFLIVYAVSLTMLAYLRGAGLRSASTASVPPTSTWAATPWRGVFLALHAALLLPFALLSAALYSGVLPVPFAVVAVAWHACALALVLALISAAAPLRLWIRAVRRTGILPLYALLAASAAVLAIQVSQRLWEPCAALTFRLVLLALQPWLPALRSNFATLTVSTDRFAVTVSEQCSGLEGIGLMLAFCATWLWLFRREYRFPRALIIVPVAVLLAFILNVLRIAALVAIGDAGYPGIAAVGFHSQAGWIAFNLVAFGVAIGAKRSVWLRRPASPAPSALGALAAAPSAAATGSDNATAAYLMPLLAILGAGMIAHALSAGFELLYPLRWVAALAALWVYRKGYASLDWRCTWRAPALGVLVAGVWFAFAHFLLPKSGKPAGLALLPAPAATAWLTVRVLAATITVPIAEELAYRGYLLRRLTNADFQAVRFDRVRWPALAFGAAAFAIMHGGLWLPALIAGLAYGAIVVNTGRLGEAVVAHATSNALIAAAVLGFDQWQLW
jgi:exosortase E/protease (VPEID-CTERM system)